MTNKINTLGILLICSLALVVLLFIVSDKPAKNEASEYTTEATERTEETVMTDDVVTEELDDYVIDEADFYTPPAAVGTEVVTELSADEVKWLLQMREEEKLARDVYQALGEKWGTQIFYNIAGSEQTHTDAIKVLLDRYGVADPMTNDTPGVFADAELQALYDSLVAQGSVSLEAALKMGATVEDLDIYDLDVALSVTDHDDIATVYQNLQKGSRNHLRAFIRQIDRRGASYTPQYISSDQYELILATPQERGAI